jgi:hypothetical protein
MIIERGNIVRVIAGSTSYSIEPSRYELGLSRVEMIDLHLSTITTTNIITNTNTNTNTNTTNEEIIEAVDDLLDARLIFARREHSEGTASHGAGAGG